MENQAKVVLGYWAIRGLSQRIRQLLQYLSIPYTEVRYEGPEGRAKWFNEDKSKLIEKNPALTLPYLIDGDRVVTESDAIIVYLCHKGKRLDLLGRNADEQVDLATAHGIYKDFHPQYISLVYGRFDKTLTFEQAQKATVPTFEPYLKKLNGILGQRQFIAGQLTWFDFTLADFMQTLNLLSQQYLLPFPKLIEYQKRVWGLPELSGYFSSDRFKERPCNNYIAAWK